MLVNKNEELERRESIKSRFFSYISHELRNPLTIIRGHLDSLKPHTKNHDALQLSVKQTHHLESMLDQLLQLSRLETNQLHLSAARTDLRSWITAQTSSLQSTITAKGLKLQLSLPSEAIFAFIDTDKFQSVLSNLLGNAIKHTPFGGLIIVALSEEQSTDPESAIEPLVRLSIRDTGTGIPKNAIPHIYERFYQSNREDAGYGIGLALVKELTELHGGHVEVTSEEGAGTCFSLLLPLGKEHLKIDELKTLKSTTEIDERSISGEVSSQRPRLLYVEDNTELRQFVTDHLKKTYDVIEASNGIEALNSAERLPPDIIVSDVIMSGGNGIDFLTALKANPSLRTIPVILLSALSDAESRLQGLEAWAHDYLSKPFEIRELSLRIRNTLAHRTVSKSTPTKLNSSPPEATEPELPEHQAQFVYQIRAATIKHLDNLDFDIKLLAKTLGISEATLRRRTQSILQRTPTDEIRRIRLEAAHEYIQKGTFATVSELAYAVGFKSRGYFSKLYQKYYGTLPSQLLKPQSD